MPASRSTWYCSGVSFSRHSASVSGVGLCCLSSLMSDSIVGQVTMFRASSKSEISRSMNTVWAWLSFTLAWWTLIQRPDRSPEAPSADRDHVRGERVRVEVGFDGKGDHDLARFEGGLSQFDPGLRWGRPPGLLLEFPGSRLFVALVGLDDALHDRPPTVVATGEERPSRMGDQKIQLAVQAIGEDPRISTNPTLRWLGDCDPGRGPARRCRGHAPAIVPAAPR